MKLKIRNKIISHKHKPFIISELGINHSGSLEAAKRMVDLSLTNGADAIKNQTHILDNEMISEAKKIQPANANESIYNVIKKNYLKFDDEVKLKKYVEKKKSIYMSTPFSLEAAVKLNEIGVSLFKIGSGECNNYPLIEKISEFKKPIILSTGMNDLRSVKESVKILEKNKVKFALLHCISEYPVSNSHLKLDHTIELRKQFPKALIGYSDHSIGITPAIIAMSKGACIIEKHFTDSKKRKGPDIICSMDPIDLKNISEASKIINISRGIKTKITKQEKITAKFAFASVVTVKSIRKGEKLNRNNIWVKRPGNGDYLAKDYNKILGRKAKINIADGVFVRKKHIK